MAAATPFHGVCWNGSIRGCDFVNKHSCGSASYSMASG
jgi:hypothetical protein